MGRIRNSSSNSPVCNTGYIDNNTGCSIFGSHKDSIHIRSKKDTYTYPISNDSRDDGRAGHDAHDVL